jgi:hypothetical protein
LVFFADLYGNKLIQILTSSHVLHLSTEHSRGQVRDIPCKVATPGTLF